MSARWNISFLVEPKEAVYFGPPRSFVAGESHHSKSMFPLSPTTFQGLLRSRLLEAVEPPLNLNDRSSAAAQYVEKLVGQPDALPEDWQITGPFLVELVSMAGELGEEEVAVPWVPAPRFLFFNGEDRPPLHGRVICSSHPGKNDLSTAQWLVGRPEEGTVKPVEGWIDCRNLQFALAGEGAGEWLKVGYSKNEPSFVKWERHPGLAIDRGGNASRVGYTAESLFAEMQRKTPGSSTEDGGSGHPDRGAAAAGMLYFLESLRFRPKSGMGGWFSGTLAEEIPKNALNSGVGVVGRHSRFVCFYPLPPPHPQWRSLMDGDHLTGAAINENQLFWLMAVTPAAIRTVLGPELNIFLPADVQISFHTALTGKAIPIGGYQIASGRSRPTQPYVPAGSCWLFQISGGNAEIRQEVLNTLHGKHVLAPAKQAQFGYGLAFVGIGPSLSRRSM